MHIFMILFVIFYSLKNLLTILHMDITLFDQILPVEHVRCHPLLLSVLFSWDNVSQL